MIDNSWEAGIKVFAGFLFGAFLFPLARFLSGWGELYLEKKRRELEKPSKEPE